MESIVNFNGGMESDLSKQFHKPNTYLQALNFRPINEINSSTGSLVNIKGNECKITFPNLQHVYKLQVVEGTLDTANATDIEINGSSSSYNITNSTTGLDLYNFIITNYAECYQYTGSTVATKTFAVAYEDNYIVIYQQPVYQDCSPVNSEPVIITTSFATVDGSQALLYFIQGDKTQSLTQDDGNPYVEGFVSAKLIPIGSTFILNDIYIFVAPEDATYGPAGIDGELPYNDNLSKNGSIWKLNIDDITKQHTLTLLYSNNLDFTKYHPIPPSAISGRYESVDIKRVYWSDNYNKIRVINTALPQLMALNPTILSVMPIVEYTQGVLKSIGSGSLPAGCYQFGYRLSKVLGSVTNFSELSNPVYLTNSPPSGEATSFYEYEGNIGATGKSITWTLDNLDLNFDQIEPIVTYRNSEFAVPTVVSLGTRTISSTMDITYSDPTATTNSELTLEEFLLFNGTFTHAKTCDTKDNRLFWGNVRAPRKDLESYDARAFRARDNGGTAVITLTNNGTSTDYTYTQAKALAQTEDTINEYYNPSTGDYSNHACYLKPSTVSNPQPELGGEGVNISYSFGTYAFNTDDNAGISGSEGWNLEIATSGSPYRGSSLENTAISSSELVYTYPQNDKFKALKQPERTSLLKGFQHEEIYRFGIQFFDKQGNPYFTKWIGDIKMPSYGDYNHNPANPGITDFRLSYQGASNDIVSQTLYIKFTVNTTSIDDLIGGYQIVRVRRSGNNKTIWGVGMINPFTSLTGNDATDTTGMLPAGWESEINSFVVPGPATLPRRSYKPYPSQESVETLNVDDDTNFNDNFGRFKSFDCFDFDLGLKPTVANTDRILVRAQQKSINYRSAAGGYRQWFGRGVDTTGADYPGNTQPIDNGIAPPFISGTGSNNDNPHQPYFIHKLVDEQLYCSYLDFLTSGSNQHDYYITKGEYVDGNNTSSVFDVTLQNAGIDHPIAPATQTSNPCGGKQSMFLEIGSNKDNSALGLYTTDYGCIATTTDPFYKLLALYYKPNSSLYGGNTYTARSNNEYIPCGEYVPTIQDGVSTIPTSIKTLMTFGGDVFTVSYDFQKIYKADTGAQYYYYNFTSGTGVYIGVNSARALFSTSFFMPTTSIKNSELRLGKHINRSVTSEASLVNTEDDYLYETYCNAENDTKTYFPKPLNFQTSDEWINRVYFSEIKFNNEPQDSWSEYLTNNFYDVEGNYGGINALISLKENMYYIQDRGVGLLMINPVSMVNDGLGQPIKLGASTEVIQKHYYKAIDAGTVHQWSVYRSQSAITFVDTRHKKIYLFNGESVTPISDTKGQRSFIIKRLHNELLKNDNPIINKGILTTYDYYHNEFLYTFNNNLDGDTTNNENLTLAYSEVLDAFSGMYSFTPNLYINSNKYLISTKLPLTTDTVNKLWFHNYGNYGVFYNTTCKSNLKLLINENPLYTKIFDNITWNSESIKDNNEWNDDYNLYPGSPTNPSYVDDVNNQSDTFNKIRCYNDWQNTDWTTLTLAPPNNNLTRKERNFNLQVPRNKFDYDSTAPSIVSIFNPANLTKLYFGERMRDKYMIVDLEYPNTIGNRFIIHNLKTIYRISDR